MYVFEHCLTIFIELLSMALIVENMSLYVNIARGTTDPGYWVYGLNHFSDWNQFELFPIKKIIQVLNSMPWVRCASGNVSTCSQLFLNFWLQLFSSIFTCISSNFGHQVESLVLVPCLDIR